MKRIDLHVEMNPDKMDVEQLRYLYKSGRFDAPKAGTSGGTGDTAPLTAKQADLVAAILGLQKENTSLQQTKAAVEA